jgi:hypothetical protein
MDCRRRITHFLVIFAIITSVISPACAFISGQNQSFIEICSGIGNKSVPSPNRETDSAPDMTQNMCEFCFHAQYLGAIITDDIIIQGSILTADYFGYLNEIALIAAVKSTHARAPPAFSLT